MAEQKTYIADKSSKMIHPGAVTVPKEIDGEVVHVEREGKPITFANGRYTTSDPEEQALIESHSDFAHNDKDGMNSIHIRGEDQALEEMADENEGASPLKERLLEADGPAQRAAILEAEGLGVPSGDVGSGGGSPDEEAELAEDEEEAELAEDEEEAELAEDELEVIKGVSNKGEALSALNSIDGVDPEGLGSAKVDEVDAFAANHGYTFDGWPT
jgi:hypothetical protein